MLDAISISQMALNEAQEKLAVDAQNVANINTHGYQREIRINQSFQSQLDGETQASNLEARAKIVRDHAEGSGIYTAKPLDLMIEGEGYFTLEADGQTYFTRQGHFHVNKEGMLVSETGAKVLGLSGNISPDAKKISIDTDGVIWIDNKKQGQLELRKFPRTAELDYQGFGLYKAESQGEPVDSKTQIQQGFLENSNVKTVDVMSDMMQASRDFQSSQKVMKAYDDILNTAINHMGSE